jgi:hypothetical protein
MNSNSWWADKLGVPRQTQSQPRLPEQQVPVVNPGVTPQYPGYTPNQGYPPVTQQPPYNPELAGHMLPASAMNPGRCPNCSSGNYGKMTPETAPRCYDCGYPIQQSGSGMPGVRVPTNGNTAAAKQISTANNFNPGTIVDRIG